LINNTRAHNNMAASAKSVLSNVKNIIFDLDGTLIDSSAGVIEATNYALLQCGYPAQSAAKIKSYIGSPLDEMFPNMCNGDVTKLKAFFHERAREIMVDLSEPLPGAEKVLLALKKHGVCLAIATTKFKENSGGTFAKFGWVDIFDAMAFGDEVAKVKPAPDIIELVLTRLDAKKDETLMVGDTRNDILAARAAGLRCVAVSSPFTNDDLTAYKPLVVIPRLADLLPLLGI
jgi:phosphoglycolate phosphatase